MVAVSIHRLWPRAPRSALSEVRLGRDWRPQAAAWSPALAFRVAGAVQDAKAPLQPSYELARTAKAKADDGPHTQASSRRRREGPCGSAGPPAATAPRSAPSPSAPRWTPGRCRGSRRRGTLWATPPEAGTQRQVHQGDSRRASSRAAPARPTAATRPAPAPAAPPASPLPGPARSRLARRPERRRRRGPRAGLGSGAGGEGARGVPGMQSPERHAERRRGRGSGGPGQARGGTRRCGPGSGPRPRRCPGC